MIGDTRILIVDDHALVRAMLAERLKREQGFVIVGQAETADLAIEMVVKHEPHIVLMDIDMPGMISFEAVREIRRRRPKTKVLFLSAYTHDRYIAEALQVKAVGYVTKREPPEQLVKALHEVRTGGSYYSEEVRNRIVVDASEAWLLGHGHTRDARLTPREKETLRYIARGLSKREIAEQMHISVKTVGHHTARIMEVLGIHDRVELARYAFREGLADP